jgi:hypothetical protein
VVCRHAVLCTRRRVQGHLPRRRGGETLTDRGSLLLIGRCAHLIGDAAYSPIVESQLYAGIALSYKFDLPR